MGSVYPEMFCSHLSYGHDSIKLPDVNLRAPLPIYWELDFLILNCGN